jgi:sec-independent protein translocase protein TatC
VRLSGVLGLLRGAPVHPVGPDGQMALSDHFRELRARLVRIVLYLVVGTVLALYFYDSSHLGIPSLFDLIWEPYNKARQALGERVATEAVINDLGGPLLFQLKLCGVAGVVLTSPLWLYEIWRFVLPGLHKQERRYTRLFAAVAGPFFLAGVALGYYVLPKGITVLLGFTPGYVTSLVDFGNYFSFIARMLLVFGVAMEIPLFVVLLNLAGIVTGRQLGRFRPWIIVGTFVFAAVATPSTDPFSMLLLAIPMTALFIVAEIVARIADRARGRNRGRDRTDQWGDDELSPL